jgi:hypothetical protein
MSSADNIDTLRETIWRERDCDVHLVVENRDDKGRGESFQILDAFLQRQGMQPLGSKWREISREAAFRHVCVLLHEDSAHHGYIMSKKRAMELATEVLATVAAARYFTNADLQDGLVQWGSDFSGLSFDPITKATLDSGVVMINETEIGLFWVEDED